MDLINIGICVDNKDPKGLGRIRYKSYNSYVSEKENAFSYEPWDEDDALIAFPFLPAHINIIPQIGQSIQLIIYNTSQKNQNQAYIAGPYGTPHDHNNETFLTQHKNTTYGGVIVKDLPDLITKNGQYIDKRSVGSQAKNDDVGFYGNYGSDAIFTIDGLFLRGGKYVTKDTSNKTLRQRLSERPIMSDKVAKLYLKKFPKTMNVVEEENVTTTTANTKINNIVEYSIDDLSLPTTLNVYVYRVLNTFTPKFNTNEFNETTKINNVETKLINEDDSLTTPTVSIPIDSIRGATAELRDILHILDQKSLFDINIRYTNNSLQPFYFRPSTEFKTRNLTTQQEKDDRLSFIQSIALRNISGGKGLCYSKESMTPPTSSRTVKEKKLKTIDENKEQTFSALVSDKMYLLSTNTNKGDKPTIDYKNLNPYEYTQEDYLKNIEPNTYSLVRGETLIKILSLLYEFTVGHVHNINDTGIYKKEKEKELGDLINTMSNDLINKSIKVN